ncbi:MAG TPA: sugar phosphate nucleotidyltransferase [Candidatus Binataceae bacterium]|nr:sugar phosphate nucleotidyltransferase [Candidatus Binataceae bacterium]
MHTSEFEIDSLAAIILAGGNGTRLSSLTRKITGKDTPKQFCSLFGNETLLEQTRRRVALAIPPSRTITVLAREHEPYFRLMHTSTPNVIVQPSNRGTAPAILYALLRLIKLGHRGVVAVFPADHYVSHEHRFMLHVQAAAKSALLHTDQLVLLGVRADKPESQYGWIEPAIPVDFHAFDLSAVVRVKRFWEKPDPKLALELLRRGYLWNTSVIAGTARAFLDIFARALPQVYGSLAQLIPVYGTAREQDAVGRVYSGMEDYGFSDSVLSEFAENLSVLPVFGLVWNDLGEPGRVFATIDQLGYRPKWLQV